MLMDHTLETTRGEYIEVVTDCAFCTKTARIKCGRCRKSICAEHSRAMNPEEVYCLECAEKVRECLNQGHTWGEWHQYAADDPCTETRECTRCNEQEMKAEHKWISAFAPESEICVYLICTECGKRHPVGHQFKVIGSRSEAYVCQICGHLQRRKRIRV
jgi:hypothetical protein